MVDNIYSKHSHFSLLLSIVLSIDCNYDYTMDYMENVARNFTKKYPSYLIHKKSEDKIKAFLTDRVKAKVETFVNAEAKNVAVTEVREIADLIAEYEGAESSSSFGSHPTDSPSLGNTGVELAMSVDTGVSDINVTERSLVTSCSLQNTGRSDDNPNGFIIEQFTVLENKDIRSAER